MTTKERALRWRYVEVAHTPKDGDTVFRAFVLESGTPGEAAERAVEETRRAHPDSTDVEEFMQRTVAPERAQEITAAMRAKTWEGWELG